MKKKPFELIFLLLNSYIIKSIPRIKLMVIKGKIPTKKEKKREKRSRLQLPRNPHDSKIKN